jgi:hypothetical protein
MSIGAELVVKHFDGQVPILWVRNRVTVSSGKNSVVKELNFPWAR